MGCCSCKSDDEDDILDNVVVETGSYRGNTAPRTSRAQSPPWGGRDGSVPRTYVPQVPRPYVPKVPRLVVPKVSRPVVPKVSRPVVPKVPRPVVLQVPRPVVPKVPKMVVPELPRVYDPQPTIRPAPTRPLVTRGIFAELFAAVHPQGMFQDELDGRVGRHQEENQFFHVFFSAMDNKSGYRGVLRRWEKASQEAMESGERVKWSEIWQRKGGYITTLDRIRGLVQVGDKHLSVADLRDLREWAGKVVSRRKKQYEDAQKKGKADPKHLKALESWKLLDKELKGQW